ncbi:MAG: vanadium-dependent haloperoxidase, partial [Planctomycetales bacterium]|nr:vanadium-dependent haloperoxidase [Planctomycetales bacterium]
MKHCVSKPHRLARLLCFTFLLTTVLVTNGHTAELKPDAAANKMEHSAAYQWLDILLEASAQDVERIGARPTILSRQMAIPVTAAFDAWAAYDEKAVGTRLGGQLRRPAAERTQQNKETAIAFAMYRTLIDQLPFQREYIDGEMRRLGYDPTNESLDVTTPEGIGNRCAQEVLAYRHADGANQLGNESGSDGTPYADYTMYRPVNPVDSVIDADRWQPLPFADGKGGTIYPGFLTPHWYRVLPFAIESSEQFRAEPPPLVGSPEMQEQVDECIRFNCNLTVEQKAIVEFMRDGPRSTGQSGHWLRFAQAVSRRDKNNLDQDVKLFFTVGNTALDAFIAAWDSKRYYDTSRPWTLIRLYYADKMIRGWAGPGKGVIAIKGNQWLPYSPATFVTPPFPGYVSGHSTVSSACATILKLFEGADEFTYVEHRRAGALTESDFECLDMQKVDGKHLTASGKELSCDVDLPIRSFTEAAEMAGIS